MEQIYTRGPPSKSKYVPLVLKEIFVLADCAFNIISLYAQDGYSNFLSCVKSTEQSIDAYHTCDASKKEVSFC